MEFEAKRDIRSHLVLDPFIFQIRKQVIFGVRGLAWTSSWDFFIINFMLLHILFLSDTQTYIGVLFLKSLLLGPGERGAQNCWQEESVKTLWEWKKGSIFHLVESLHYLSSITYWCMSQWGMQGSCVPLELILLPLLKKLFLYSLTERNFL